MAVEDLGLEGRPVCLVLACRKPYYAARLAENLDTFRRLQDFGFPVVFLYGDGVGTPRFSVSPDDFIELIVPVEESYLRHPAKIDLACQTLLAAGCTGILKMDDDTRIVNWNCIKEFATDIMPHADYFGICRGHFPGGQRQKLDPTHFRVGHLDLWWDCPENIEFYIGSFYWISRRVMEEIARRHLTFPLEDVNVGYIVSQIKNAVVGFLPWFEREYICWSYEREPLPPEAATLEAAPLIQ